MSRVVTNLQEAATFAFQDSKQTFAPKPTFAALSKAMVNAASSINGFDGINGLPDYVRPAFIALRNQLFLSPRLPQWQFSVQKDSSGYWLKSKDESVTVTVREDKVILSVYDNDNPKYPSNYDVVDDGLAAAALFKSIQDAQALVQPRGLNGPALDTENGEEFFEEDDPEYAEGAALDAALEETQSAPLVEDDAELIEDVCQETISPTPDAINIPDDEPEPTNPDDYFVQDAPNLDENASGYITSANRKNTITDGVICSYCGNLNQSAYKGTCPQCPRQPSGEGAKQAALMVPKKDAAPGRDDSSEAWLMGRLKSLQGRVLTILDASPIADKAQRDAVKSLLNKEFRREMNRVSDGGWRAKNPRYEE